MSTKFHWSLSLFPLLHAQILSGPLPKLEGWEHFMVSALSSPNLSSEIKISMLSPYFESLLRTPPSLRSTVKDSTHNPQTVLGVERHPLGAATLRFLFLFEELYGQYFLVSSAPPPTTTTVVDTQPVVRPEAIKRRTSWGWEEDNKGIIPDAETTMHKQSEDVLANLQIDIEAFIYMLGKSIQKMWKKMAERYGRPSFHTIHLHHSRTL